MDEPTKGMDAWTKEQLGRHLKKLCSQGISILLVTHDPVSYTHLDVYKRQP